MKTRGGFQSKHCHVDVAITATMLSDSKTKIICTSSKILHGEFWQWKPNHTFFFEGSPLLPHVLLVGFVSLGDNHEQHRYSESYPVLKCLWRLICLLISASLSYLQEGHRVWKPILSTATPASGLFLGPFSWVLKGLGPVCQNKDRGWVLFFNWFVRLEMLNNLNLHVNHVTFKVVSLFAMFFFSIFTKISSIIHYVFVMWSIFNTKYWERKLIKSKNVQKSI